MGISIVNGAQTTGSIASLSQQSSPDLQVAIRFVKANKAGIIEDVVRFNNSQNRLQAADFRSTDPIQERLRSEFNAIPEAEYEGGRRGGASDAIKRSKFTLPSYTVGQSLAAFHGDPVTAYDRKSELWTNEKNYRLIFTDRTTARHIVFCYSLLTAINDRKLHLCHKQKSDPASLTGIENTSLALLNKKGAHYLLVHVISQCMETILWETYCEPI
jgi:AIPR protein